MRKIDATGAGSASSAAQSRDRASRELVCLALILAVGALLLRIASAL
jgi:hypothetical protein